VRPGHEPDSTQDAATRAVAVALHELMAARLGRGFVPLALLFAWGAADVLRGEAAWVALGAVLTAGAMLAYGLRIVQRALGRQRVWMAAASVGSLIPAAYALYLLGWLGLRALVPPGDTGAVVSAILYVGAGVWVFRCWMNVVEIERLAQIMAPGQDEKGGAA